MFTAVDGVFISIFYQGSAVQRINDIAIPKRNVGKQRPT